MGQSLTHLLVHAIFSTKDRRPFLRSEEIRNEIHAYIKAPRRSGRPREAVLGLPSRNCTPRRGVGSAFRASELNIELAAVCLNE